MCQNIDTEERVLSLIFKSITFCSLLLWFSSTLVVRRMFVFLCESVDKNVNRKRINTRTNRAAIYSNITGIRQKDLLLILMRFKPKAHTHTNTNTNSHIHANAKFICSGASQLMAAFSLTATIALALDSMVEITGK